jgi:hypothetical protein
LVRGSFDPNDKAVEPSGSLLPQDSVLTYTIRFQNTGTDYAFTVAVRDTLSANLDVASIKTLITSHPYSFSLKGTRNAEWRFDNILLPDSNTSERNSHGFVKFSINRKKGLAPGVAIENMAHIYFDFNPAVATNLVRSTLTIPTETVEPTSRGVDAWVVPNPNKAGNARVVLREGKANGHAVMTITDALGRVVFTKGSLSGTEISFDAKLTTGIYFLHISEEGNTRAQGRFAVE